MPKYLFLAFKILAQFSYFGRSSKFRWLNRCGGAAASMALKMILKPDGRLVTVTGEEAAFEVFQLIRSCRVTTVRLPLGPTD
jgi:hypothetical protein